MKKYYHFIIYYEHNMELIREVVEINLNKAKEEVNKTFKTIPENLKKYVIVEQGNGTTSLMDCPTFVE